MRSSYRFVGDVMNDRIVVLRLGHRIHRDERITTHVCLTARAFGADGVVITGDHDRSILESVRDVVNNWGGPFWVEYVSSWKRVVQEYKDRGYLIVHLTMYGINLPDVISEVREGFKRSGGMLIVLGGAKVPGELYRLADYNLAVTNQPHSEVSALAVFLDHLFEGREFNREFTGGRLKIIPSPHGKHVIEEKKG